MSFSNPLKPQWPSSFLLPPFNRPPLHQATVLPPHLLLAGRRIRPLALWHRHHLGSLQAAWAGKSWSYTTAPHFTSPAHHIFLDKSRAPRSVSKSYDNVFLAQFSRPTRYVPGVHRARSSPNFPYDPTTCGSGKFVKCDVKVGTILKNYTRWSPYGFSFSYQLLHVRVKCLVMVGVLVCGAEVVTMLQVKQSLVAIYASIVLTNPLHIIINLFRSLQDSRWPLVRY